VAGPAVWQRNGRRYRRRLKREFQPRGSAVLGPPRVNSPIAVYGRRWRLAGRVAGTAEERYILETAQVELSEEEVEEAEKRALPRAAVVFETIRREGEGELNRTLSALLFSAVAAGLSMGFSLFALATFTAYLPDASWRPLVASFGYTVGFLIAILGRQQLFTENTLTPILVLLNRFEWATFWSVVRLWLIVIAGNLLGALIFATLLAHAPVFTPELQRAFGEVAVHASSGDAWPNFVRAIYAGWLIALMVWLLPAAESAAMFIIMLLTYLVAAAELTHVVAGSVEALYSVEIGKASIADFVFRFFIPVFAGNSIGGVTFVALLSFGQVAGDAGPRERKAK
jgi:formate/nitrite transporter FocA (FNT family)